MYVYMCESLYIVYKFKKIKLSKQIIVIVLSHLVTGSLVQLCLDSVLNAMFGLVMEG